MSLESEVYDILNADSTLKSLYLTGGIFKAEDVGVEGITRETTPDAFDSDGFLEPCALIRHRSSQVTGELSDVDNQLMTEQNIIEIWIYQDRGYDKIDGAMSWLKVTLLDQVLDHTFELELVNTLNRQRDGGALNAASLGRMDWAVQSVSMDWPIS